MATNHRTSTDERPQAALLDDSDFLRTLVEVRMKATVEHRNGLSHEERGDRTAGRVCPWADIQQGHLEADH